MDLLRTGSSTLNLGTGSPERQDVSTADDKPEEEHTRDPSTVA